MLKCIAPIPRDLRLCKNESKDIRQDIEVNLFKLERTGIIRYPVQLPTLTGIINVSSCIHPSNTVDLQFMKSIKIIEN